MQHFLLAIQLLLSTFLINNAVTTSNVESIEVNLKEKEIAVSYFSLKHGEATLLQHPNGEHVLINTGAKESLHEVEEWLKLYGVDHLSTIIVTKNEPGAIGNIEALLSKYNTRQLVLSKGLYNQIKLNDNFSNNVTMQWWEEGTTIDIQPHVEVSVLANGDGPEDGLDFSINFFSHRFLFLSSIGPANEQKLSSYDLKDVNFVKLPMYGGPQSLTTTMLKNIDPQVAVIFANPAIEIDRDVLERLDDYWVDVYITKYHGSVTVKCTDVTYEILHIHPKEKQ